MTKPAILKHLGKRIAFWQRYQRSPKFQWCNTHVYCIIGELQAIRKQIKGKK